MSDTLKFVHLTDLHFSARGTDEPTLLSDTTAAIRNSFTAIARLAVRPAFIVISGDLMDRGNIEDYRALRPLLAELAGDIPVICALGNHDRRENFHAVFGNGEGAPDRPYDHDVLVAGLHVITLDTAIPGKVGGQITPEQMDWLRGRLCDHPQTRKLLVLHHSPLFDEARENAWDRLDLASTRMLRDAIAGKPVAGILSGHVHLDEVTHWYGVPVVVGAGHHAATDPLAPADQIRLVEASGLALCTLRPSGLAVTYLPHPQSRALLRTIEKRQLMAREMATGEAGAAA